MCGRGRFAILAACLLSQYAQPCQTRRRRGAKNGDSVAPEHEKLISSQVKEENDDIHINNDYPIIENLSPGMECPVLFRKESETGVTYVTENMVWGIIPTYLDTPSASDHYRMFNKRIESLERSEIAPYFKTVLQTKRCVAVMDGFYEWKTVAGKKQPYYVSLDTSEPMCMAGIYEESNIFDPKLNSMRVAKSFSILTGEPCSKFSTMHFRQPILLTEAQLQQWLDCPADEVFALLNELKSNYTNANIPMNKAISFHPVTAELTNPRYQQPDCSLHRPLGTQLTAFFKPASLTPGGDRDIALSSSNTTTVGKQQAGRGETAESPKKLSSLKRHFTATEASSHSALTGKVKSESVLSSEDETAGRGKRQKTAQTSSGGVHTLPAVHTTVAAPAKLVTTSGSSSSKQKNKSTVKSPPSSPAVANSRSIASYFARTPK